MVGTREIPSTNSARGEYVAAHPAMGNMIVYAFLVALCIYVARTWLRWFRSKVRLAAPRWRSEWTS